MMTFWTVISPQNEPSISSSSQKLLNEVSESKYGLKLNYNSILRIRILYHNNVLGTISCMYPPSNAYHSELQWATMPVCEWFCLSLPFYCLTRMLLSAVLTLFRFFFAFFGTKIENCPIVKTCCCTKFVCTNTLTSSTISTSKAKKAA